MISTSISVRTEVLTPGRAEGPAPEPFGEVWFCGSVRRAAQLLLNQTPDSFPVAITGDGGSLSFWMEDEGDGWWGLYGSLLEDDQDIGFVFKVIRPYALFEEVTSLERDILIAIGEAFGSTPEGIGIPSR